MFACSNLSLNNVFRNFHTLLDGEEATSMDIMFLVESLRTRHHLKEKPFYSLFKEFIHHKDTLEADGVPCNKTIKTHLQRKLVGVSITFEYRNRQTGRTKKMKNVDSIPRRKFKRDQWQLIYTVAKVVQ